MQRPFSIENEVGRFVEVRIRSPIALADVKAFAERLREVVPAATRHGKAVFCIELLGANVFAPEVADGFIAIMRKDNPVIERSAFFVGQNALFSLQIERLIRDSQNPARRSFRDASGVRTWLGEVLGPEERSRLDAFLAATTQ